jgi:hypothetical protein
MLKYRYEIYEISKTLYLHIYHINIVQLRQFLQLLMHSTV